MALPPPARPNFRRMEVFAGERPQSGSPPLHFSLHSRFLEKIQSRRVMSRGAATRRHVPCPITDVMLHTSCHVRPFVS
jgi:hypothetical protein